MTYLEARKQLAQIGIAIRQRPGEYHLSKAGTIEPRVAVETLAEAIELGLRYAAKPKAPVLPPMGPVFKSKDTVGMRARRHNAKLIKSGKWNTKK